MKYYNVTGINADGSPNDLKFDHVSEWSLSNLIPFFADSGVILEKTYAYSIDDRPVYCRDPSTDELVRNTGQVL